jgi:hypothetical protein
MFQPSRNYQLKSHGKDRRAEKIEEQPRRHSLPEEWNERARGIWNEETGK